MALNSRLTKLRNKYGGFGYLYSDLGFFFLQKIIETITGYTLDVYLQNNLFDRLGLQNIGYNPLRKADCNLIAPSEYDLQYRKQIVRGYVHDPMASLQGGVGGHAGLFSNALDIATILQMNLQGGKYGGEDFFSQATMQKFNSRPNAKYDNRRGIGWDKPLMKPQSGDGPTSDYCPQSVFGHTGFTGTCAWADPDNNLVYVFLSNRTFPTAENRKLSREGFRTLIQEIKVESGVLKVTPPSIDIELQPNAREEADITLNLENVAPFSLYIKDISFSGLEDLVSISGSTLAVGKEIKPTSNTSIKLKAKLTEKGREIENIQELAGSITISVDNNQLAKDWAVSVELKIRITLEGALDTTACILIEPKSWEIKSYGEQKKLVLTVKNNCTVQGMPVELKDFSVRIRWLGESPVGTFEVSSEELELTEILPQWTLLSESFSKNAEQELILFFRPNDQITSASVQPRIEFSATHYSEKGVEIPKATLSTSITINNLLKCVHVVRATDIELKSCGFDTGWGLNSKYFDRDPYDVTQQQQTQQNLIWPTAQYVPPWQTSQPGQSTQWKCQSETAEIIVDNTCLQDIDITIQFDSGLLVKPSSKKVGSGSSASFIIEPSTSKGKFNVKMLAKFSSSSKRAEEIDSFSVKVVRRDEIQEECLPTIEPTVLKANFLGWQKTVARIYNKCYHLGYVLKHLTLNNIHCYSPATGGTSLEGPCPMIKNIVMGKNEVQKVSDKEEWQIMEIYLWFDPEIKKTAPISFEGSVEEIVGNIRFIATEQYLAAVSPGIIAVPMYVPYLGDKYFPVGVTFENPLAWLGLIGSLLNKGSKNLEPAQCINPNALIVPDVLTDSHFIDDMFVWNENPPVTELVLPYARSNEEVDPSSDSNARAFCGKDDYIASIGLSSWEDPKSGVKLYFELTHNRHHIVMKVDRSKMITECAKINIDLPIKVTRVYYKKGTQDAKLKVVVNALNRGVSQLSEGCENRAAKIDVMPSWGMLKPCNSQESYSVYGFDRLLFTWRPDEITSRKCEPEPSGEGYFCDGAQFIMQIASKIRKINQKIEEINKSAPAEYLSVISIIGQDQELMREINSQEGKLYKLSKAQIVVRDDFSNKPILLFVTKEGTILGQPPVPLEKCNVAQIEATLNSIIKAPQNELAALDSMKMSHAQFDSILAQCYANDIKIENALAIVSKDIDYSANAQLIWSKLKQVADEVKLPRQSVYVITFAEYISLYEQLSIGVRNNIMFGDRNLPITATIGQVTITAKEQEWTLFLSEFANRTVFMLAVINKPGLSGAMEEYIRVRALDVLSTPSEESLIAKAESYLKADNLSRALIEDLDKGNETLKQIGLNVDQLEFKRYEDANFSEEMVQKSTECSIASGRYAYRIEPKIAIDFAGRPPKIIVSKYIVKLALVESLEAIDKRLKTKFSENPLMYMSFDGEIGKESTGANYGLGLTLAGAVPSELLYNEHGERIYPRKPGIGTITLNYNSRFEKSRTGTVLNIDLKSRKIEYVPSYPVLLRIISPTEGQNVIYYKLSDDKYYGDIKELFVWHKVGSLVPNEQGAGSEGEEKVQFSVDRFGLQKPDSFCSGWSQSIEASKLILGQGLWVSVSYVPAKAADEYLKLEVLCAKNPIVLSTLTYEGQEYSTPETRGIEGGAVRIIEAIRQPSLKEYIERIASGEICIDNINRAQLRLRWNPTLFGQ
ncbi:MAG: serine hydrolase [Candidatus Diapherotrites archaeon]